MGWFTTEAHPERGQEGACDGWGAVRAPFGPFKRERGAEHQRARKVEGAGRTGVRASPPRSPRIHCATLIPMATRSDHTKPERSGRTSIRSPRAPPAASESGELAEHVRALRLVHRPLRDLDHGQVQNVVVVMDAKPVHVEKHDGR